jgi:hypothetical protein
MNKIKPILKTTQKEKREKIQAERKDKKKDASQNT